ncbi:MAG: electron transfer flavoprotein subunit beta/FixA family protein [Bacillota bacterium]|jgi:electron transfer flavoprotein alpha/beta subunit|nr:electron transfer flavoprotein subunit beta/FixA family protein [Bacillota bacterium]NLL60195.1 electron transfer flavoprotein subunit beta/FixA family protein [Tissierellia bacterium]
MNILVCIKQVPDTTEIKINPETNTLMREGVPSIVNTFDAYALELGVRLKEKHGGKVTVMSMGPDQAKAALKECLSVGADEAYLLSDRAFGGSDTLATSFILASFASHLEKEKGKFDLILCGKQAIDGDTGQVGPEMAEHLGLAQVTYAADIRVEDGKTLVKRENDQGYDWIEVKSPAVITVTKSDFEPRYATLKSKIAANKAEIHVLNSQSISIDTEKCGLKGSPTKVKNSYTPKKEKNGIIIDEETPSASVQKLMKLITDKKVI